MKDSPVAAHLRRRAEEEIRQHVRRVRAATGGDPQALIYELQVHQVELEIQNEELRRAQVELAAARDLYADLYELAPVGYLTLDRAGKIRQVNLMAATLLGVERRRLLEMKLETFVAAEGRRDWKVYVGSFEGAHDRAACDLPLRWRERSRIVRIEASALEDGSGLRCALVDVTDRRRAEQQLEAANRSLEQRVAERTASVEATNRALRSQIAENERIARELRERSGRLRTILDTAAEGIVTTDARGRIETGNAAAERIFGYGGGEMVGLDIRRVMPGMKNIDGAADAGAPMAIGRWRDLRGKRRDGSVVFVDLSVSEYEETEGKFAAIIRDVSERRRLQREIAQRVTQEQQALGRNLHDGVAQQLAAAELLVGVLQRRLEADSLPAAEMAADLVRVTHDAQQQLRAVMRGVLPYTVQAAGLRAALRELAETTGRLHGIGCSFENGDAEIEDPHNATQLYYIANEAVHNCIRHARASQVLIGLSKSDGRIALTVADDGVGMPEREKIGAGMGIMRYRANLIDAELTVRNAPRRGTIVTCTLPPPPDLSRPCGLR